MEMVSALTNTSLNLTSAISEEELLHQLVRCSCFETDSCLSAIYMNREGHFLLEKKSSSLLLPLKLSNKRGLVDFIIDCREYLIYQNKDESFLTSLFLLPSIKSAALFPLSHDDHILGLLILNSKETDFYGKDKVEYLHAVSKIFVSSHIKIHSSLS